MDVWLLHSTQGLTQEKKKQDEQWVLHKKKVEISLRPRA